MPQQSNTERARKARADRAKKARADRLSKPTPTRTRRLRSIQGEGQADAALSSYDGDYLLCRDLKHPWSVVGYFRQRGEVRRLLRCPRCEMQRIDRWLPSGERVANQYQAPEGYRIPGGGVTAHDVRRETLSRVTIFENHDDMVKALLNGSTGKRKRA